MSLTTSEVHTGVTAETLASISTPDRVETRLGALEFTDGAPADASLNIGAVSYPGTFAGSLAELKELPQDFIGAKPVLETGVADAQCIDGMLLVKEIRSTHYASRPMGRDNYHIYDYNLFHMNLRQNVETRVARYLANPPPKPVITKPSLAPAN